MWVRGLKLKLDKTMYRQFGSHPMWVRGLKQQQNNVLAMNDVSHPMWVRGLKLRLPFGFIQRGGSRTPCGCVD